MELAQFVVAKVCRIQQELCHSGWSRLVFQCAQPRPLIIFPELTNDQE